MADEELTGVDEQEHEIEQLDQSDAQSDVHTDVAAAFAVLSDAPEATEKPAEKVRDEQGRFAASTDQKAPDQKPVETTEQQPVVQPAYQAPTSWDSAAKADWAKATPALQAAIAKREAEVSNGFKQYADMVEPVKRLAIRRGLDTGQAIRQLAEAQEQLDRNPVAGLRYIAQMYGVDLGTMGQPQQQSEGQIDLSQYLNPIQEQVMTLAERLEAKERAEAEARQREQEREVEGFAADKPHFYEVAGEVIQLIPLIKQQNPHFSRQQILTEAYQRATRANPTVWSKLEAERQQLSETKRSADQKAKVDASRKANVSIKGAPNGSAAPPSGSHGSAYDDVAAAFAALRG